MEGSSMTSAPYTSLIEEMDYRPTHENVFQGEYRETRLANRRVVCAACRIGDIVLAGARHFDTIMHSQLQAMRLDRGQIGMAEQGFVDQFGIFLTRQEAYKLAEEKGQINGEPNIPGTLFSEDLY
jgi:hypothetical protein